MNMGEAEPLKLRNDYGPIPNRGLSGEEYSRRFGIQREGQYRLTEAKKAEIAAAAGTGTITEIAQRLGVSYGSVRTYIKGADSE